VGHFNFSELTVLKAVGQAARELDTAVVVGVSESEREFVGLREAVALVKAMRDEGLRIFLNADHTHSLEKAEEAARAGFDMIVFDASEKPIEENIILTQRAVEATKSINGAILVEGEVGYIGSGSELHDKRPENIHMTEPADARGFVVETRVDLLSPSVGTTHGMIPSMVRGAEHKRLDIPRIAAIKNAVQVPLTLHGGSGTDAEDFRKSIKAGIIQNELGSRFDLRGAPFFPVAISHRKSERSFGDIVDLVARVRSMPRGSFTALFGADAGNDDAADAVLDQPGVEAAANERTVAAFVEDRVRCEREPRKRDDVARTERKGPRFFDVENLHDRDFAKSGAVDERLHTLHKQGHVTIAPIGAMAE
jgi:fructose-bisphosphate aldolase, class II